MLPLRHAKRWRIAGIAILSGVLVVSVMPTTWLWPDFPHREMLLLDKSLHVLTFILLAVWFSGQYQRRSYWRLMVGLAAFGLLIELCQRMVSYRTTEWADLAADILGTGIGLSVAIAGLGGWSLRFERWMEIERVGADVD